MATTAELDQFFEAYSNWRTQRRLCESHDPDAEDDFADCLMIGYAKECAHLYELLSPEDKLWADALEEMEIGNAS
jgi:hypothetical protein